MGGGWNLEWLHPPPKRERETLETLKTKMREEAYCYYPCIPHMGLYSYNEGIYK